MEEAQKQARDGFASPAILIAIGNATTEASLNDELEPHGRGCDSVGGFDIGLPPPLDVSDLSGLQDDDNHVLEEDWLLSLGASALSLPMSISQPLPQSELSVSGVEFEPSTWDFLQWPKDLTPLSSPVSQVSGTRHSLNVLPLKQLMKDIGLSGG